jgi:hypothetical protein
MGTDARTALARQVVAGRLLFAGEGCHDGMAGTLAGAWIGGRDAAHLAAVLAASDEAPLTDQVGLRSSHKWSVVGAN